MKTDELLYLVCGYAITLSVGIWLPWAGVVAGVLAALGRFIYDKCKKRNTFGWQHLNVSLVGVIAGLCISILRWYI